MKTEEFDGKIEKELSIAMIVSKEVLAKLVTKWDKESFRSSWANQLGSLCVEHYRKHKEAPKAAIVSLFQEWCKHNKSDADKQLMERFLSQLSRRYEKLEEDVQPSHTIELATRYFNEVKAEKLADDIARRLERGDTQGAISSIESFRKVSIAKPKYIDVLRDAEAQKRALENSQKVLIRYSGGAGEFFGNELAEDSFIAFLAPMKSAKSYFMLDLAWKAMLQGRKVAYFQVGDMTQDQIMRRFQRRAARRPLQNKVVPYPIILLPGADGGIATVEHEARVFEEVLSTEKGIAAFNRVVKKHKSQRLRLSCHASKTICMNDIRNIVEEWRDEGWKNAVCIIDYSDNLAPNNPKMRELDQVEDTWTYMRQLSEIQKNLVITATQSAASGFNTWVLTKKNFSRNKMILAHVTGMVGINQTEQERDKSQFRLNWIVSRDSKFSEYKCCHVAACLDIGQAIVLSHF